MKRALLACLLLAVTLLAVVASAEDSPTAIRQAMNDQVAAWNRGDVEGFMAAYKNAPDTTFIGKQVSHGFDAILERYKKNYTSREGMGVLSFSDLDIRLLDQKFAVVTGRFLLQRTQAGGGAASGVFSLVWEKTSAGWKIIVDHTS